MRTTSKLKSSKVTPDRGAPSTRLDTKQTTSLERGTEAAPIKRRDAAATKARILEAAMQEFAAKGPDARIEDIAEMAGANRRMAYFYFGSKEGLYLAALEATYLELAEVEQAIDVDALGPVEAIAALVCVKFDHFIRYPRYVSFLNIENLYQARHLASSERIGELRGPLLTIIGRVLQRGKTAGVFRSDIDPLELYLAINALGYYVFSNQYTLSTVFNVDLMSPESLARRRSMIADMVTSYLTNADGSAKAATARQQLSHEGKKDASAKPKTPASRKSR